MTCSVTHTDGSVIRCRGSCPEVGTFGDRQSASGLLARQVFALDARTGPGRHVRIVVESADQEDRMFVQEAENRFQTGLQHLARGRARDALPFIGAAVEVQQERSTGDHGQAIYLSYQGLCLCLTRTDVRGGLHQCRRAAKLDPISLEIWWNLGRVALMAGRRGEAYRAFREGLRICPGHPSLSRCLLRMGRRRPPVLSFLGRRHPVNVLLGRLRPRVNPDRSRAKPNQSAARETT